jgi:para-aminobenzoate synthetase component 1
MPQMLTLTSLTSALLLAVADFFADWTGTCLLYSGGDLDSARYSFLGLFPFETLTVYDHQFSLRQGKHIQTKQVAHPWQGLQEYFGLFSSLAQPHEIAFGWLGYGLGAYADEDKVLSYHPSSAPDAYWQRCALVLVLDHHTQLTTLHVASFDLEQIEEKAHIWIKRLSAPEGWECFLKELTSSPTTLLTKKQSTDLFPFVTNLDRKSAYINQVQAAKELIRAGEIYQVNLSQEFRFSCQGRPFSFFRQMCHLNPAPFSAYFRGESATIISTSPERFLCKKGHELETRPIKGTMPRGRTMEEDEQFKMRLLASSKERAELLMITDLMRNDLGKVSETGSVVTEEIWRCEAYTNVFHLLSIIRSKARQELSSLDIVRACFPGGSITGCPKLRAMEVIEELENRSRGLYTGSIGYFTAQGDFDLNIAIRTLVIDQGVCSLQLGSGIVFDSDPEREYQETLFKGSSLFHVFQVQG